MTTWAMTDSDAIIHQLKDEGFGRVFVWRDGPGAVYPDHTHPGKTAHVVLEGEITITSAGQTVTYRQGDRFDVPANQVHRARAGSRGCVYVVGE